ncbi:hypothetical protein FM21_27580 [Streptomyces mutabilis]|uniref:MFS transporter n=1 Tax=Streptomyces mutabilis TaxID=67332 RepID=A0A086N039_9ACTN|nr:hypothetical protein FM21_27580 [Streptomyces mutabilis]
MPQTTDAAAAAVHGPKPDRPRRPRMHRAWWVAAVTFVTIIGAAAFRSLPGILIDPLHQDFA